MRCLESGRDRNLSATPYAFSLANQFDAARPKKPRSGSDKDYYVNSLAPARPTKTHPRNIVTGSGNRIGPNIAYKTQYLSKVYRYNRRKTMRDDLMENGTSKLSIISG